eukprot:jgi/Mesen1/2633/ME000166S01759
MASAVGTPGRSYEPDTDLHTAEGQPGDALRLRSSVRKNLQQNAGALQDATRGVADDEKEAGKGEGGGEGGGEGRDAISSMRGEKGNLIAEQEVLEGVKRGLSDGGGEASALGHRRKEGERKDRMSFGSEAADDPVKGSVREGELESTGEKKEGDLASTGDKNEGALKSTGEKSEVKLESTGKNEGELESTGDKKEGNQGTVAQQVGVLDGGEIKFSTPFVIELEETGSVAKGNVSFSLPAQDPDALQVAAILLAGSSRRPARLRDMWQEVQCLAEAWSYSALIATPKHPYAKTREPDPFDPFRRRRQRKLRRRFQRRKLLVKGNVDSQEEEVGVKKQEKHEGIKGEEGQEDEREDGGVKVAEKEEAAGGGEEEQREGERRRGRVVREGGRATGGAREEEEQEEEDDVEAALSRSCGGQRLDKWLAVRAPHLEDCDAAAAINAASDTRNAGDASVPSWAAGGAVVRQAWQRARENMPRDAALPGPHPPWVAGADEHNYPLTREAQRDIWLSQHPPDCGDPGLRFLLAKWPHSPRLGLAAKVRHMAKLLAVAVQEGWVLVSHSFPRAKHYGCQGRSFAKWQCYFAPEAAPACWDRVASLIKSGYVLNGTVTLGWEVAASHPLFGRPPTLWGKPWESLSEDAPPAAAAAAVAAAAADRTANGTRSLSWSTAAATAAASSDNDATETQTTSRKRSHSEASSGGARGAGWGPGSAQADERGMRWWHAQAARYLTRFPSAGLCRRLNYERHRTWGQLAAAHVISSFQEDSEGHRVRRRMLSAEEQQQQRQQEEEEEEEPGARDAGGGGGRGGLGGPEGEGALSGRRGAGGSGGGVGAGGDSGQGEGGLRRRGGGGRSGGDGHRERRQKARGAGSGAGGGGGGGREDENEDEDDQMEAEVMLRRADLRTMVTSLKRGRAANSDKETGAAAGGSAVEGGRGREESASPRGPSEVEGAFGGEGEAEVAGVGIGGGGIEGNRAEEEEGLELAEGDAGGASLLKLDAGKERILLRPVDSGSVDAGKHEDDEKRRKSRRAGRSRRSTPELESGAGPAQPPPASSGLLTRQGGEDGSARSASRRLGRRRKHLTSAGASGGGAAGAALLGVVNTGVVNGSSDGGGGRGLGVNLGVVNGSDAAEGVNAGAVNRSDAAGGGEDAFGRGGVQSSAAPGRRRRAGSEHETTSDSTGVSLRAEEDRPWRGGTELFRAGAYISMHVAVGGAPPRERLARFRRYMMEAERVRVRFPWVRAIWLTSEAQVVIDEAAKYSWWQWLYTDFPRLKETDQSMTGFEQNIGWQQIAENAFVNILLAGGADYYVGTRGSDYSLLINGLRCTAGHHRPQTYDIAVMV